MQYRLIFISLLIAVLLCGLLLPAGVALADSTPILLLSGKTEGNEVVVEVTIRGNEGILAMNLTLDYDRERLVLTGFEKGEALATLDLMSTNTQTEEGYGVYPFVFNWFGEDNDATNGKLLTLHFAPIGESDGKARVSFTYNRNQGVTYIEAGTPAPKTRNPLIDTLQIDLSKGKVTDIESEIEAEPSISSKDNNALAVGLTLSGVTVVALAIGLPLLWRKKHL